MLKPASVHFTFISDYGHINYLKKNIKKNFSIVFVNKLHTNGI